MLNNTEKRLSQLALGPTAQADLNTWLSTDDSIEFLHNNAAEEYLVLYASIRYVFIHAIAVPNSLLASPDLEDLLAWNYSAYSSWSIVNSFDPPAIHIANPPHCTASSILDKGEQLVFARDFGGRLINEHYCEILQQLVHTLGIHFLEERSAYCRFDTNGDLEDVIRLTEIEDEDGHRGTIVSIKRDDIDEYLAMTESSLVRTFDFTRTDSSFGGWRSHETVQKTLGEITFRSHSEADYATYTRGIQIVQASISVDELRERMRPGKRSDERFASFIAVDWKNNAIKEISCAPGMTANYFQESDLPFELSPAFFRPEVLSKYKADSDKYSLTARTLTCRDAWHLQNYDINAEGQVHTYLVYLRNLPYMEQLHWKSHNERPKGPISERALKADFEGCWDLPYEPLESIKEFTGNLNRDGVGWWKLRSSLGIEKVHCPVTSSPDEWGTELLQLDQLIVEGMETAWIKREIGTRGGSVGASLGSLTLLIDYLVLVGVSREEATETVAPLKELHSLRTKLKGHATGKEALKIRQLALKQHGSYRAHFEELCSRCDKSLRLIANLLSHGNVTSSSLP